MGHKPAGLFTVELKGIWTYNLLIFYLINRLLICKTVYSIYLFSL